MSPAARATLDRASSARRALVELVAERGLHATSVSEVAKRAGVAAGTIYVHYPSKDGLVAAAHAEAKGAMAAAAVAGLDLEASPEERFVAIWLQLHHFLRKDPALARFVVQLDSLPVQVEVLPPEMGLTPTQIGSADSAAAESLPGAALVEAALAPDMVGELIDLPLTVLWDLGLAPAIRAAAMPIEPPLDDAALAAMAHACWRAITRG
jgi:AcrR family transcriptional regulator